MRFRTTFLCLVVLACACFLSSTLHAQTPLRTRGEKYALLIGVRQYNKDELRNLPYSEKDVESLATLLKAHGYRSENVRLMTQRIGAEDTDLLPTGKNIRRQLDLMLSDRIEADSILIAFAGHGVQFRDDKESFFCPADAKLGERASLVPFTEVYKTLEKSQAGFKLLLVDACRNDPQSDNSRSQGGVKLETVTKPQRLSLPGGVAALYSCSEGEKAYENEQLKHGVFFHFVIQGLQGQADGNKDRQVTLPELTEYVQLRVPDFVKAEHKVRQMPEMRGILRGSVPILTLNASKPVTLPPVNPPAPPRSNGTKDDLVLRGIQKSNPPTNPRQSASSSTKALGNLKQANALLKLEQPDFERVIKLCNDALDSAKDDDEVATSALYLLSSVYNDLRYAGRDPEKGSLYRDKAAIREKRIKK